MNSTDSYEIIERYPEDRELPSYLIHTEYQQDTFHVVFAVDREEQNVRVITAYRPDPEMWSNDFKERRE